jgi:NAD(P)-dependent dehydrogenase (short-subunit alcohol dehydrogenase family)
MVKTDLSGQVAVVAGASRGLGREIALALAAAGANVVVAARDGALLNETASLISTTTGGDAHAVVTDVTSNADVQHLRDETEERFGTATILVNAAAIFGPVAPFSKTDPAEWVQTLMVNTAGAYLTCRAFVPGMLAAGWGRIVSLSSAASLGAPGLLDSAYSTSKAALNRMTRHLAAELEGTGVAAAVMHPGSVKTEMWAEIQAKVEALEKDADPLRRWVDVVEQTGGDPVSRCADLVLELVDPRLEGRNGEFCWLRDALDAPIASW